MHAPGAGHHYYTNGLSAPLLPGLRSAVSDMGASLLAAVSSPVVTSQASECRSTYGPTSGDLPAVGDAGLGSGSSNNPLAEGAPESQAAVHCHSAHSSADLPVSSGASASLTPEQVCFFKVEGSWHQKPFVLVSNCMPHQYDAVTCRLFLSMP